MLCSNFVHFFNILYSASRLVSYGGDEEEDDEASKVKVSSTQ